MNQNSLQQSIVPSGNFELSADQLSEVSRLLTYIEQTAIGFAKLRRIDSENTPIHPAEIPIVANLVIERIVWRHENLQQIIQEALDDLRFGA